MKKPEILFLSPYKPYPKKKTEDDNIDFFYYRNTLKQGLLRIKQVQSWHPLHFIAQNLPVFSVVVENPSWWEFCNELKKNNFDIVCITFTIPTTGRILKMVKHIRQVSRKSIIILGGYGTCIFSENSGIEEEIKSYVDHICTGEGISFMKKHLKDYWGIEDDMPITQNLLPAHYNFFRTTIPVYYSVNIISSLGCNNRCSFCSTSHQFKKKITFVSGKYLYSLIKKQADRFPHVTSAVIYNENFLSDRKEVLEFMKYMEQDHELASRPFHLTIFSSAQSISQYTIEELLKCGIGLIFIGVESLCNTIIKDEQLHKRGDKFLDIKELCHSLHTAGINTLGSMIVGWDGHTRESVQSDLKGFVDINPTMYQIVPLQAIPGTLLWNRMKKQNRIIPDYSYDTLRLGRSPIVLKHLTPEQSEHMIYKTYKDLVNNGGPWPFRMFENLVHGILSLSSNKEPIIKSRIKGYKKQIKTILPLAIGCRLIFHGRNFKKQWKKTMKSYFVINPFQFISSCIAGIVLFPFLLAYCAIGSILHWISPSGEQRKTVKRVYNHRRGDGR